MTSINALHSYLQLFLDSSCNVEGAGIGSVARNVSYGMTIYIGWFIFGKHTETSRYQESPVPSAFFSHEGAAEIGMLHHVLRCNLSISLLQ